MIRSSPVTRYLPVVAGGLVALALVAPPMAASAQQERLPKELWEQYPLDPTPSEEEPSEESPLPATTRPEEPSEERPPPATTLEEPADRQGGSGAAAVEPGPEPQEGTPWLLLLLGATLGFSGVLGIAVGIVLASRRGVTIRRRRAVSTAPTRAARARRFRSVASLAARPVRAVAVATRWRPSRNVVERLHSEAGSLAPLAEPRLRAGHEASPRKERPREPSRKAKPLRPAGAPPQKEELPGISPPAHKRKRVTSGLPLGKDVNTAAEEAAGRPAAGGARAQPEPRPMLDSRRIFEGYLFSVRGKGVALIKQREAHLFDEYTQQEEESDWGWGVVAFLEDTVGKAMAAEFEEQVLTYIPPTHLFGIEKGRYETDVAIGVAYLDGLIGKAETIPLRGFDPEEWTVT
jgi:hypothetical protein